MTRTSPSRHRASSAAVIYVIVLMAMQVFLVTVAAEAFLDDQEGLAWATAGVSLALFAGAAVFLRQFRS